MAHRSVIVGIRVGIDEAREPVRHALHQIRLGNERTRARLYLAGLVDRAYRDLGIPRPD